MGGCKCTYRNCTVKSDGQTHMFHYPVFDKFRCHQWLTNAQRLNFLDLKVSQLKNRVVCQHHFTPDNFMNYMMDKLRFDAVPTENGPFCDAPSLETPDVSGSLDIGPSFEITPEDIENDKLTANDKKANLPVKYANFLTNSELITDLDNNFQLFTDSKQGLLSETKNNQGQPMLIVPPYSGLSDPKTVSDNKQHQIVPDQMNLQNTSMIQGNENNNENFTPKKTGPNNKKRIRILSEKKISTPVKVKGKLEPVSPSSLVIKVRSSSEKSAPLVENTNTGLENMEAVICNPPNSGFIVPNERLQNMEAVICNPPKPEVLPRENLDNIQPNNKLLELPIEFVQSDTTQGNRPLLNFISDDHNNDLAKNPFSSIDIGNKKPFGYTIRTTIDPVTANTESDTVSPVKSISTQNISKYNQPKVSLLKPKIPPERVAAIEEKRNFNKKLRDMIEFCLDDSEKQTKSDNINVNDKLHNQVKVQYDSKKIHSKQNIKNENVCQSVASHLSKESNIPCEKGCTLASIEARMQRMELLINRKIERNSQLIADLKDSVVSAVSVKKSVVTQTEPRNEEAHKKELFNEISIYLSPEASSLIYEEMFLSKFKRKSEKSSVSPVKLPKRRRNR